MVLNSAIEKDLREKIKSDPVVSNMYAAIKLNAETIYDKPLLERIQIGRRLLSVSREMLYRVNMLGMVYRMEKDPTTLKRLNDEIVAVCNFRDWNPSHYLDVAEMSLAVALALDWTMGDLPKTTEELAIQSLIEKGIKPSWPENGKNPGWSYGNNNWNQVCNGGMIAASIAIAERDPELATKTISRALDGIPHALVEYMPHGVYPEGSTYWGYGTGFSVITVAMLESAFGTDFGHSDYPGFKESALFRVLSNAPSGWYYNFADCGDKRGVNGDATLAWFASKTGNNSFFEKDRFLMPVDQMSKLDRLDGAALVWISQYKEKEGVQVPSAWKGEGANPIVIFTGESNDPHHYYLGGKGGRGTVNHGNMDGGSFVFELNGVRWVVDPGNQDYNDLEKTGFDLWGKCQECERWTLLTKNNFGHSTLAVNDELHKVNGLATIKDFKDGNNPEATFELTPAFHGLLKSAQRKFRKDSPVSLTVEDVIEVSDSVKLITWQLMTTADVELTREGAILRQDSKSLKVENLSHPGLSMSVVSLDPAPLKLDRQIAGLKRIELRIPAWTIENNKTSIRIRLAEY
ncbi:MAG: heparinase II/III family protein [Proteiniphilum sp.]